MEEVRAVVDEAHKRRLMVVGTLASARGDPPRTRGRRRRLRAHRTGERAGVSRGHHPDDPRADGAHEPRARFLDADDRRPVQLRIHARQSRAARRSSVAGGLPPDRSSPTSEVDRDIRIGCHTSRSTPSTPADARAQVQAADAKPGVTLLIGTDSGIPMKFHSESTWHELDTWVNLLGVDPMTGDPRRHLLAGGRDESGSRRRHGDARASTPTSSRCSGDVLRYIALLQRVDIVVKKGTRFK